MLKEWTLNSVNNDSFFYGPLEVIRTLLRDVHRDDDEDFASDLNKRTLKMFFFSQNADISFIIAFSTYTFY